MFSKTFIDDHIDAVIVNGAPLSKAALDVYAKYHEIPVQNNLTATGRMKVVKRDVASRQITTKSKSDALVRSLIRHDSKRLADALVSMLT